MTIQQPAQINLSEGRAKVLVMYKRDFWKGFDTKRMMNMCYEEVRNAVERCPKYDLVFFDAERTKYRNSLTRKRLTIEELEEIKKTYDADLIICLYNASTNVTFDQGVNSNGQVNYSVNRRVRFCFTVHDTEHLAMIDDYCSSDVVRQRNTNQSMLNNSLIGPTQVATANYIRRILPHEIVVRRNYYAKGSDDMKAAAEHFRLREYEQAQRLWEKVAHAADTKEKLKGRAFYNMALAEEEQGNFEKAIDYVQKAARYRVPNSARYERILRNRIIDEKRFEDQVGE